MPKLGLQAMDSLAYKVTNLNNIYIGVVEFSSGSDQACMVQSVGFLGILIGLLRV